MYWLAANKLTLNTNKSNFLIIKPRQKKAPRSVNISINGGQLKETDCVKYLGVLIDKNLTWKPHAQNVNLKFSKSLDILAKSRHVLSKDILPQIHNSFIAPHIYHGIINWGGAYSETLDPLRKKLKQAVRMILFKKRAEHNEPLFKSLGLLTFDDIYKHECAKFMFEVAKGNVGSCISDLFHLTSESHGMRTRQATNGNFSQPPIRTNYKTFFLTNSGVKTWNDIPSNIKNATSKKAFSRLFKQLILKNTSKIQNNLKESKKILHFPFTYLFHFL